MLNRGSLMKGRTYEEIYGPNKAEFVKSKLSNSHMGQIAWNKGKTRSKSSKKKQGESMRRLYREGNFNPRKGKPRLDMKGNKFRNGKVPWNKGLTKETDKRVKEYGLSGSKSLRRRMPWNRGIPNLKMRGESHHNWKGGKSRKNWNLRSWFQWRLWRSMVFKRDNYTCQNTNCKYCNNVVGTTLHPHHIKPKVLNPELVFNLNNGITYCAEYHLKSGLHKNIMRGG